MTEMVMSKPKKKSELFEWIKTIGACVLIVFIIRTFVGAPYVVDGHSMDATLQNGERLIINKMVYDFHSPQKGDIIVFHATPTEDYIKRVIAQAGDTVQEKSDVLYINGKAVQEPYLDKQKQLDQLNGQAFTTDFGPITVPTGKIFVMGDNRPVSKDSRYIGPVDVSSVVGRADFSFWPLNLFHKL